MVGGVPNKTTTAATNLSPLSQDLLVEQRSGSKSKSKFPNVSQKEVASIHYHR
jgi:hypothetical protein